MHVRFPAPQPEVLEYGFTVIDSYSGPQNLHSEVAQVQ